jgi:hypothetical protein
MPGVPWQTIRLPQQAAQIFNDAPDVFMVGGIEELIDLSVRHAGKNGIAEVAYNIPGYRNVAEARVRRRPGGVGVSFPDPAMRSLDPDCTIICDDDPASRAVLVSRFGTDLETIRQDAFAWLSAQELCCMPFLAPDGGKGAEAIAILPANAGFYALGLALLHGMLATNDVPDGFSPRIIFYIVPPLRHTHFDDRQVVIHNRQDLICEIFCFNVVLAPSPDTGLTIAPGMTREIQSCIDMQTVRQFAQLLHVV